MKSDKATHFESLSKNLAAQFQKFHEHVAPRTRSLRYPQELIESACDAYKQGVPRKMLVKSTGLSSANLNRWFQKSSPFKKPRRLKVVDETVVTQDNLPLSSQTILIRLKSGVVIELPSVECLSVPFLKTLSVVEVA